MKMASEEKKVAAEGEKTVARISFQFSVQI